MGLGEGTNQSIDVDEFDLYYNQMFIWDEEEERVVGAYRLGLGKEIVTQYGKRGFYIHTLFRIDEKLNSRNMTYIPLVEFFIIIELSSKSFF